MNFSSVTIDVWQPNRTIEALIEQVFAEVGATVRLFGPDAVMVAEEVADVLLLDMDAALGERGGDLIGVYREAGAPVLVCGLRNLRERLDEIGGAQWLERPFSPSSLLAQVASLLGIEVGAPIFGDPRTVTTREEPIRKIGTDGPVTREIEVDEASLLEEEFGLEPGVLGGGMYDKERGETNPAEMLDFEDAADLIEEIEDLDPDDSLALNVGAGRVHSRIRTSAFRADAPLGDDQPTNNASAIGPPPPFLSRPAQETMPDMPAATISSRSGASSILQRRQQQQQEQELQVADDASTGATTLPDAQAYATIPEIDDEASLELRSFARMLAEAWGRVGQSARVEDRFDRLNRVLHALFERGLDGAGDELKRIPHSEGFNGSLRAISIVGLLKTIRDRKLRGRLEVSAQEQGYVLYLDGGTLVDIDALVGDPEQMLLHILRDHGALSAQMYQELLAEHEDPNQLSPPVEMRLRMEGLVSEASLAQARLLRGKEIFRRVCRARSGNFAFIEIFRGDAHAWPAHELRVSVDELLLELLREESSVETGVSEATSRAHLAPDPGMLAKVSREALTANERDVLRFFQQGGSIAAAREQMTHLAPEVDAIIRRLKKAGFLHRVASEGALMRSGEYDAAPAPMERPRRRGRPEEILPTERTVITEIEPDVMTIATQSAADVEIPEENLYPLIEEDEHDKPTRSVKGHDITPPMLEELDTGDAIERLIEEITTSKDGEGG